MQQRTVATDDWKPERSHCHSNVNYWVTLNPHLRAIRGWIVIGEDADGRCRFQAHSVIEDTGELYDITLPNQPECDRARFLPHTGTEEQFFAVEKHWSDTEFPLLRFENIADIGAGDDIEDGEFKDGS